MPFWMRPTTTDGSSRTEAAWQRCSAEAPVQLAASQRRPETMAAGQVAVYLGFDGRPLVPWPRRRAGSWAPGSRLLGW